MEWIVPVLFVLATAAQWWLKHRHQSKKLPLPPSKDTSRPARPDVEVDPIDDFGDLLEALGKRRHDSPPAPVLPSSPEPVASCPTQSHTVPPVLDLPPVTLPLSQPTPILDVVVTNKSRDWQKTRPQIQPARSFPRLCSRLREAVVMSEILAPPLALR